MGKLVERISFGRIQERGIMPHFLEFQLNSYEVFYKVKKPSILHGGSALDLRQRDRSGRQRAPDLGATYSGTVATSVH